MFFQRYLSFTINPFKKLKRDLFGDYKTKTNMNVSSYNRWF